VSDRNPTRRPGRGAPRPSPASLGVVRAGDGFAAEFPDGDAPSTEATATLVRAGTSVLIELDRTIMATFGVAHPVVTALAVIEGAEGPLTPSEISERVLVASATMTATLDALESRGWVVRAPNPADRRSVLVAITDQGRATADRFLPGIRTVEMALMSGLTAKEREQLVGLLAKVLARAAEVAEEPVIPLEGRRNRPAR
jgi:DNA-binding MarR family transcriptional regulator